jgi:uncharacterized transporter YbjL
MCAAVVLLGAVIVAGFRFLFHFSVPVIGGVFAGATTNTPSLAAAQAALQNLASSNPASSYSMNSKISSDQTFKGVILERHQTSDASPDRFFRTFKEDNPLRLPRRYHSAG